MNTVQTNRSAANDIIETGISVEIFMRPFFHSMCVQRAPNWLLKHTAERKRDSFLPIMAINLVDLWTIVLCACHRSWGPFKGLSFPHHLFFVSNFCINLLKLKKKRFLSLLHIQEPCIQLTFGDKPGFNL